MKKTIWLSYDLGVRGDYPGLYRWLDNHNAKECGNSVAIITLEYPDPEEHGNQEIEFIKCLVKDLRNNVDLNGGNPRIYIIRGIYANDGENERKVVGKFIIGKRRAEPWKGYGDEEPQEEDDQ